jgi:hypothetical protein
MMHQLLYTTNNNNIHRNNDNERRFDIDTSTIIDHEITKRSILQQRQDNDTSLLSSSSSLLSITPSAFSLPQSSLLFQKLSTYSKSYRELLLSSSSLITSLTSSSSSSSSIESSSSSSSSSSSTVRIITPHILNFLPDFTEHPKPVRIRQSKSNIDFSIKSPPPPSSQDDDDNDDSNDNTRTRTTTTAATEAEPTTNEITFFHDFIAGGVAGSMSVIVGHPFDT